MVIYRHWAVEVNNLFVWSCNTVCATACHMCPERKFVFIQMLKNWLFLKEKIIAISNEKQKKTFSGSNLKIFSKSIRNSNSLLLVVLKRSLFIHLGPVADPVIEAIARLEFEDGLRTGVLLGGCWCPWGGRTYPRINTKPPWGCGMVLGWVWLS